MSPRLHFTTKRVAYKLRLKRALSCKSDFGTNMKYEEYLDDYNNKHKGIGYEPLKLDVLNDNHQMFSVSPENALKHSLGVVGELKEIIEAQLLSIGSLALYLTRDFNTNSNVIKSDFPAKDFQLGSSLIDLANTADSAFKLALSGFSTQSRILIRSLIERKMQLIVIYHDPEDFEKWYKATETDESKLAYYLVSSKKGRLLKQYKKIELELLGMYENKKVDEFRVHDYEYQSMSVHGGSLPVNVGSWAFIGESVNPSLFGAPCDSVLNVSRQIASHLSEFSRILEPLLVSVHEWTSGEKHELVNNYMFYRHVSECEFKKYVDAYFEPVEKT